MGFQKFVSVSFIKILEPSKLKFILYWVNKIINLEDNLNSWWIWQTIYGAWTQPNLLVILDLIIWKTKIQRFAGIMKLLYSNHFWVILAQWYSPGASTQRSAFRQWIDPDYTYRFLQSTRVLDQNTAQAHMVWSHRLCTKINEQNIYSIFGIFQYINQTC